ncbi:MAG: hypothetical protein COU85_00705 [Candidatus Portnoybacteria bacterium CG10_big_fil_rev_8_21_14_0_10_44_7]|uniref:Uncharacterized protein n=1 Tax=Candidatus Portnoybacteria bacterium CG10_big_fil_rev_8_21_14_0_10_44_7 TaxID=1974816 RepID=A0A2M8KJ82_9BACT|nr:MAG: hypothetical protein COU85_00705 [Candidatus Portnoybacteria bacterium CG10_big_fil_rev_8_21_14_0_10_44_7]
MPEVQTENIAQTKQAEAVQEATKKPLNKKWLLVGILVALLNPIFAGLILGAAFLSEPGLKREGQIVTGLALLWGGALFYWLRHNFNLFF